jgi:hypothetical protein
MTRAVPRLVAAAIAAAHLGFVPAARAQTPAPPAKQTPPPAKQTPPPAKQTPPPAKQTPPPAKQTPPPAKPAAGKPAPKPKALPETRVRLVLNFAVAPSTVSYGDLRTPTEYAETSQIRTSYEGAAGLGADVALQLSLWRGLGILAGYSHTTRDATGTVDVTRPHPLYLNRPRTASAEITGGSYSEGAIDLDLAYARSAGHLDWALFAGVTLFQVDADLLDVPTYNEVYPYDQLTISSTPSVGVQESATGWNAGGRLDYRFGKSKTFGVGVELRYSSASVELTASQAATPATIDTGGLTVGAGVRLYF